MYVRHFSGVATEQRGLPEMGTGKCLAFNIPQITIHMLIVVSSILQTEQRVEALLESFRPGRERERDKLPSSHGPPTSQPPENSTSAPETTNNDVK